MPITGENFYGFDHKMTLIFIMGSMCPNKIPFLPYIQMYFMYIQRKKKSKREISIIMSAVVTAGKEITLGDLNFLLFASLYFLKFPQ